MNLTKAVIVAVADSLPRSPLAGSDILSELCYQYQRPGSSFLL